MSALPSARVLRRALGVVGELPPAALAALIEALVNKLDAAGQDADAEPDDDAEEDNQDCCPAGDDDPASPVPLRGVNSYQVRGPGDPADAEDGEPAECEGDLERCEVAA